MITILKAILLTPLSYLFCDDPTPNPEFDELTFWGRVLYYNEQLKQRDIKL